MKALTITGAVTAAIVAGVTTYLTPWVVLWGVIVAGLGLAGMLLGWGSTEAVKRLLIVPPPDYRMHDLRMTQRQYWNTERGKRRIYAWAISTAWLWTQICGVVFLLVTSTSTAEERQWLVVIGILWFVWSSLIGLSSPWLYRWTFKHVLPRLNRMVDAGEPPAETDDLTVFNDREKDNVQ